MNIIQIDKNAFLEKNISHYHKDYISYLKYDENNNMLYSSGLDGKIFIHFLDISNQKYIYNFDYCKNNVK